MDIHIYNLNKNELFAEKILLKDRSNVCPRAKQNE